MKYSHVIFDLDGTLVDSASEIHEAAAEVCREHELLIPSLDYIRSMSGSPPSLFFLTMVVLMVMCKSSLSSFALIWPHMLVILVAFSTQLFLCFQG